MTDLKIGTVVYYKVQGDEGEGSIKNLASMVTDIKYPEEGGNPQVLLTVFTSTGPQVIAWLDKQGDEVDHWNFIS